jgi:type II secretory pathway component PulC
MRTRSRQPGALTALGVLLAGVLSCTQEQVAQIRDRGEALVNEARTQIDAQSATAQQQLAEAQKQAAKLKEVATAATAEPPPGPYAAIPGQAEAIKCKKSRCTIAADFVIALRREPPERIAREVAVLPAMGFSGIHGVVITRRPEGGVLDTLGFEEGDVIKTVGSRRIASAGDLMALSREVRTMDKATIELERAGKKLVITIEKGK